MTEIFSPCYTVMFLVVQMLPEDRSHYPPMTFNVHDTQGLKYFSYVGTHIQLTVARFLLELETHEQRTSKMQPAVFSPIKKDCK
jgi:hypothetical protein